MRGTTMIKDENYYDFEDWELADTQAMLDRLEKEANNANS